ncbi:MAG: hypothetical protein FWD49_03125 [Firmicutes bacterium]|nr:hypothetical protein [Bacillota bacterium]
MNKLKAYISKFMSSFTVKMSEKPILMTVVLLLFANLIILAVASVVAIALQADLYANYFTAFASAFRWLILPNSISQIDQSEHFSTLVLAIVVVVCGMILFTGTIIAVVTASLRDYIAKIGGAKGKLNLSDHIVILNYNREVTTILSDLMHSGTDTTVLILSDKTKEFVKEDLASETASMEDPANCKLRLVVRQGNPNNLQDLKEIALEKARGIIVMSAENNNSDFSAIKLAIKLSSLDIPKTCPIGIETDCYGSAKTIRQLQQEISGLKDKSIQPFSSRRKLGQFLALTIINPDFSGVLNELLSFKGCEFYPAEGKDIEHYLENYSRVVPVFASDKTYLLAESPECITQKRIAPYKTDRILPLSKKATAPKEIKLYLIGENNKIEYMLEALKTQKANVKLYSYDINNIEKFAKDVSEQGDENSVAVILSDDTAPPENHDLNVFLTLIELAKRKNYNERLFKVIAEILEPENQSGISEFHVENIIDSTKIVSFFATKLISDPSAGLFYEDIFSHTSDFSDFWIDKAENLFDLTDLKPFNSYAEFVRAVYNGSGKTLIPIGILINGKNEFFCEELDTQRNFTITNNDKIIYMALNEKTI